MNREQIQALIPVGNAYLWLDEVVEVSDNQIHARKFLDPALEIFQSHYVDFPLFPGALQCEAAFQAGAVLIAQSRTRTPGRIPVIARVKNVKFKRMVRPGETLDLHVRFVSSSARMIALKGHLAVEGKTTTELEFSAVEAPVGTSEATPADRET